MLLNHMESEIKIEVDYLKYLKAQQIDRMVCTTFQLDELSLRFPNTPKQDLYQIAIALGIHHATTGKPYIFPDTPEGSSNAPWTPEGASGVPQKHRVLLHKCQRQ